MYATVDDLVTRYGFDEILQLTDREHTGEIDTAIAETALADAAAETDSHLQGPYSLPLPSVPPILVWVNADIARARLFGAGAPEHVTQAAKNARRILERLGSGELKLGVIPPAQAQSTVQTTKPQHQFERDDLDDFGRE